MNAPPTESAPKKQVHFARPTFFETTSAREAAARAYDDLDREQRAMAQNFKEVLTEDFSVEMLEKFLLYQVTVNPHEAKRFLVCQTAAGVEGVVRYLRDQMFPEIEEAVWVYWKQVIERGRDEDLFWSFVLAMTLDEAVMNMVRATWGGSQLAFDCIITYFRNRLNALLEAPFDPENANSLMVGIQRFVCVEFIPMNIRAIIMNGELRQIIIPLSRNAHRLRKKEMRQSSFESMLELTSDGLA